MIFSFDFSNDIISHLHLTKRYTLLYILLLSRQGLKGGFMKFEIGYT